MGTSINPDIMSTFTPLVTVRWAFKVTIGILREVLMLWHVSMGIKPRCVSLHKMFTLNDFTWDDFIPQHLD